MDYGGEHWPTQILASRSESVLVTGLQGAEQHPVFAELSNCLYTFMSPLVSKKSESIKDHQKMLEISGGVPPLNPACSKRDLY